jgi:hypothetical protein
MHHFRSNLRLQRSKAIRTSYSIPWSPVLLSYPLIARVALSLGPHARAKWERSHSPLLLLVELERSQTWTRNCLSPRTPRFKAQGNITEAVSQAGELSGPHTLTTRPSRPFSVSYPTDVFVVNSSLLSYIALLSDRTPLPAWISFDASSLHFARTTSAASSAVSTPAHLLKF